MWGVFYAYAYPQCAKDCLLEGLNERRLCAESMDVENGLSSIDTDIDFTFVLDVHELRFLRLAIRARGPYDYSSCT